MKSIVQLAKVTILSVTMLFSIQSIAKQAATTQTNNKVYQQKAMNMYKGEWQKAKKMLHKKFLQVMQRTTNMSDVARLTKKYEVAKQGLDQKFVSLVNKKAVELKASAEAAKNGQVAKNQNLQKSQQAAAGRQPSSGPITIQEKKWKLPNSGEYYVEEHEI